jgi:hypothetical protein
LLDRLVWVVLLVVIAGLGAASALGGREVALHVWELFLVGALFAAVAVSVALLFGKVRRLERTKPVGAEAAPAPPKKHAALLDELATLDEALDKLHQRSTLPWEFAEMYHELRTRAISAAPNSAALGNLPELRPYPGMLAACAVAQLRVYLQRMKGLLEQDEAPGRTDAQLTVSRG